MRRIAPFASFADRCTVPIAETAVGRTREGDTAGGLLNAPRRQYAIFLSGGQMEVVIGDGTTRRFGRSSLEDRAERN
jgi:hypothetical protein